MNRWWRCLARFIARLVACVCVLWACGAIWFDCSCAWFGVPIIVLALLGLIILLFRFTWKRLGLASLFFVVTLTWWLSLQPAADRDWDSELARTAWAEINGDEVTIHNVRNFDYGASSNPVSRWETRTVYLSHLTGLDLALNYWGSPYLAHPIVSFRFRDALPVCFSIEIRKERGESFSLLGGLYRRYELYYVVADERDVFPLRAITRNEQVYLYRTTATPQQARARFMEYLNALNELRETPRWYNAFTTNCTTAIRTQRSAHSRTPWDWRILINGKGDELLYERGVLATSGLPFPQLKAKAQIGAAINSHIASPTFSEAVRFGRPGFSRDD